MNEGLVLISGDFGKGIKPVGGGGKALACHPLTCI